MLEYTKQAHTTIMEGTPYEQSYDNCNTLEGGKFALKEQMDSKLIQSDCWLQLHRDNQAGKQRIIEVIWGWKLGDVEIAES